MESDPKILLVDDDPIITDQLEPFLERAGFRVLCAVDGRDALGKVASFEPDLVVLDILMPRLDGRAVLRRLRQANNWVHVIMLTQVTGAQERIEALNEGADDYLDKPFEPGELLARIRAILRRARPIQAPPDPEAAPRLRCGALLLDRRKGAVYMGRREIAMSPKEFAVLEQLMLHPGELLDYDDLMEKVWGFDYVVGPEALYVRVNKLRRTLGNDSAQARLIETVSGRGYRFAGEVEVLS
jgi:DNA-binding response OmpR family regulator